MKYIYIYIYIYMNAAHGTHPQICSQSVITEHTEIILNSFSNIFISAFDFHTSVQESQSINDVSKYLWCVVETYMKSNSL
jgi:hypothetical protein